MASLGNKNDSETLVADVVDRLAQTDPEKVCASQPVDDNDPSKGYRDISYRKLAHAVNAAAFWLDAQLRPDDGEIFAYHGARDLRPVVLALAAGKTARQYQLIGPWVPDASKVALVQGSGCKVVVYVKGFRAFADAVAKAMPNVRLIECPDEQVFLEAHSAKPYPCKGTWDSLKDQPWIIFHTTGSSGKPSSLRSLPANESKGTPKPIAWSHRALRSCERFKMRPEFKECNFATYENRRFFQPLGVSHGMGMMYLLDTTISMGATMVIGPSTRFPDMNDMRATFEHAKIDGTLATPGYVKQIIEEKDLLPKLRALKFVHLCGSMTERSIGDALAEYTEVGQIFGATEIGQLPTRRLPGPDWHLYGFFPWGGLTMDEVSDGVHELIFRRSEASNGSAEAEVDWIHVFSVFPDKTEYRTRDLFTPDPPSQNKVFAYHGRTDDHIQLRSGDGMNCPVVEAKIEKCSVVKGAMLGGENESRPWLILELDARVTSASGGNPNGGINGANGEGNMLNGISSGGADYAWVMPLFRAIIDLNAGLSHVGKIALSRIILTSSATKPLTRTVKTGLDRKKTVQLFQSQLDQLPETPDFEDVP